MGNYSNNGPSFSGMRTWKPFYFPRRGPKTWFQELKAEFRREDRERAAQRRMERYAKLQAKKGAKKKRATETMRRQLFTIKKPIDPARRAKLQADKLRDSHIKELMQGVRAELARKKMREQRAILAAKQAIMVAERVKMREERARYRSLLEIRKIHERARREEERNKMRIDKTLREAEAARRKAEASRRKAEQKENKRRQIRNALAKQATQARIKAREKRLQRLLREIRLKHRK